MQISNRSSLLLHQAFGLYQQPVKLRSISSVVKILYLFFFLLYVVPANGQSKKLGTWFSSNIVLPGDSINRLGFCGGFQVRENDGFKYLQYMELKGGVNYYLSKTFTATVGMGR
jgi:hypothetical protein